MSKANILDRIIATKMTEVAEGKKALPQNELAAKIKDMPACRGFIASIEKKLNNKQAAVIAEVKKASPSKGVIRDHFVPSELALSYEKGGAACLSVLTDRQYFQGHDDYLLQARSAVSLPVLRKDFMVDPWHIYHSKALGADCILLIVAALDDALLHELTDLSHELGLDVLMEVHDENEMERALKTPARLIGINNRNLKTFETSLKTSERLTKLVAHDTKDNSRIVVSESGIHHSADIQYLQNNDINTFLIGESFMRHDDPGAQLQKLITGQVS